MPDPVLSGDPLSGCGRLVGCGCSEGEGQNLWCLMVSPLLFAFWWPQVGW